MKSSFTLRWHHQRTRHWINRITLSTLHSLVLKNLNRLNGILRCNHQLQDGLMGQQEFDRTRFIVRNLWDLKL